jgi:hypothetical protein
MQFFLVFEPIPMKDKCMEAQKYMCQMSLSLYLVDNVNTKAFMLSTIFPSSIFDFCDASNFFFLCTISIPMAY